MQKEFKDFSLKPEPQGDEKKLSMQLMRGGMQSCGAPVFVVGCKFTRADANARVLLLAQATPHTVLQSPVQSVMSSVDPHSVGQPVVALLCAVCSGSDPLPPLPPLSFSLPAAASPCPCVPPCLSVFNNREGSGSAGAQWMGVLPREGWKALLLLVHSGHAT